MTRGGQPTLFWSLLVPHAILVQVVSYGLRPSLSYAVLDLGYGSEWLAAVAALFAVPPLVLAVFTGRLVDRVGERPCMAIGALALIGSAVAAYAGHSGMSMLIASTVLLGVGNIFSMIGEQSAVTGRARGQRADAIFGTYTFMTSLGQSLGPLLLLMPRPPGVVSPPLGQVALFCVAAGVVALATSLGFGTHHRASPVPASGSAEFWSARRLLAIPGMSRALLVGGLILASIDVTLAYLPALAHARGLAPGWVTAMLAARSLLSMLSRINLAGLVCNLGRRRLAMGACAVSALALCGSAAPLPPLGLVALMAIYGFAAGVCQPMTMGWVVQLAPPNTRGTVLSLRLAGNRLAQSVIPGVSTAAAIVGGAPGVPRVDRSDVGRGRLVVVRDRRQQRLRAEVGAGPNAFGSGWGVCGIGRRSRSSHRLTAPPRRRVGAGGAGTRRRGPQTAGRPCGSARLALGAAAGRRRPGSVRGGRRDRGAVPPGHLLADPQV
ncbi:MFS transporter [Micromonospora sp. NPDC005163]